MLTPEQLHAVFERVRAVDPLLVQAVADVDRTLLRAHLALSPRERLLAAQQATNALQRWAYAKNATT